MKIYYKILRLLKLVLDTIRALGLTIKLGGAGVHYNIYAGTNNWSECRLALSALIGRLPLVDGPHIREYEQQFAQVTDTQYAFSFAAGRMALYAILEALNIGPGDEVIVPAFTCVVVPNAIIYRGAKPVYVDIEPQTFNIDVHKIEAKITSHTRAISAQHTYGLVCDIKAIREIAKRYGLVVIEDCAHALGATHKGHKVGSLGDVGFFSTDHSKVISTSTGGMVTTNDPILAKRLATQQEQTPFLSQSRIRGILITFILEYLLFHPRFCKIGQPLYALLAELRLWRYFQDENRLTKPTAYPYPARLSNAQARIGSSQLDQLADNLAWRRRVACQYEAELGVYEGQLLPEATNHAFLRYTFLVDDRAIWEGYFRDVLDMGVWFTSIAHGRSTNLQEIGYRMGSCPVAEMVAQHCVNLPTHQRITRPELLIKKLELVEPFNRPQLQSGRWYQLPPQVITKVKPMSYQEYWNNEAIERAKSFWIEDADDTRVLEFLRHQSNLERGFQDGLKFIDQQLGGVHGRVLDLGAGICWSTALTAQFPKVDQLYAVDYSVLRLSHLAPLVFQQYEVETDKLQRIVGSMTEVQYTAGTFDMITFSQAMYMNENPLAILQAVWHLLKPRGVVMIANENIVAPQSLPRRLVWQIRHFLGLVPLAPVDISGRYAYLDSHYRQFIRQAGFELHVQTLDYSVQPTTPVNAINYFGVKP